MEVHRELLQIAEDSEVNKCSKAKEKMRLSFCMILHIYCIMLYMMNLKSMVSSLEKLYSRLDPDDAIMCK